MPEGELNEYTKQRRKNGAIEVKKMLKNPPTFKEALAQTNRLNNKPSKKSDSKFITKKKTKH